VVDGASSFGRQILRGVLRYANLQRRWLLHEDIWRVVESRAHWPECSGAIVAGVTRPTFEFIRQRCAHLIHCSGGGDPKETPVVSLDEEAAGRLAAEHLMDCHLQHFGFYGLTVQAGGVGHRRLEGFRAALEARGFTCAECPVPWPSGMDWLMQTHRGELVDWLQGLPKPVGIMTGDDMVAHDLAGACVGAGIRVPEQVAIVGVNNDDLLCEGAWPPLSSVEPDYTRMGYLAAKMLDRLLAGEAMGLEERWVRLPPLGVVQRQSTNVLAVGDPNLADAVQFIREHACDPCSVQDVLKAVPVGRRWLERQFMARFGRSPHNEITRVRVDTAKRLLVQPDMTLVDIAERCGFSGLAHFVRMFQQEVGTTPAVYRRSTVRGGLAKSG
jgi:LacI family transcriptional regulator